jgi:hypothetical protein
LVAILVTVSGTWKSRVAQLACAILLGIAWGDVRAADTPDATGARSDEFVVSGKPDNPEAVRKALVEAEDRFYARYNELNKDDEYDIVCRVEAPLGKRLRVRSCEPRFIEEATRDDSVTKIQGRGNVQIISATELRAGAKFQTMRQRMRDIVEQDVVLQNTLAERGELEQAYAALLKKKPEVPASGN